jgi:hypothetical protein
MGARTLNITTISITTLNTNGYVLTHLGFTECHNFFTVTIKQVVWNKSSLLLKIIL